MNGDMRRDHRRRGRPPGTESGDTRDRILTTAREEFSERGYEKTSVRGIAKAAGVDPALVHHYFGTKEQVFEAAIEVAFAPALRAPDAIGDAPSTRSASGSPASSSASGRTRPAGRRCWPSSAPP